MAILRGFTGFQGNLTTRLVLDRSPAITEVEVAARDMRYAFGLFQDQCTVNLIGATPSRHWHDSRRISETTDPSQSETITGAILGKRQVFGLH
jgi:hypothetical protein